MIISESKNITRNEVKEFDEKTIKIIDDLNESKIKTFYNKEADKRYTLVPKIGKTSERYYLHVIVESGYWHSEYDFTKTGALGYMRISLRKGDKGGAIESIKRVTGFEFPEWIMERAGEHLNLHAVQKGWIKDNNSFKFAKK